MDKKLGIIADTSRGDKRVMQGYFEMKQKEQIEAKKQNRDSDRGMNLYVNSAAKYRDGALNLSKQGIKQIEGKAFNKEKKGPHPSKRTYEVIA